jgi:hypothetical protein
MAWSPTPASPGPCSASGNPEAIAGWPMVQRLAASEPAVHQPAMRGPVPPLPSHLDAQYGTAVRCDNHAV